MWESHTNQIDLFLELQKSASRYPLLCSSYGLNCLHQLTLTIKKGKIISKNVRFTKLWLTCAWPPVYTRLQSPTTWRRTKSQTRWTSGEDPQPASQPCCLKCVASGLWSTCQKSWPILTTQEDQIKQSAAALVSIWCIVNWVLSQTRHFYCDYVAIQSKNMKKGQVESPEYVKM